MPPVSVDEQLQREAAGRRMAVIGAALGALLPLAGVVAVTLIRRDDDSNELTGQLLFQHEHATALTLAAILQAAGALFIALALRHLYIATKARRPELPRVALICAVAGPIVLVAAQVAVALLVSDKADQFASTGNQTRPEGRELLDSGDLRIAQIGLLAGTLAFGFAFVMISLNAMRVGLLSRFMGILGVIVGVLTVIPVGGPLPIVQTFWLGAIAVLFAGRWPQGMPPAWSTGRAEPWPSQQELRERRQRARGGADEDEAPLDEEGRDAVAAGDLGSQAGGHPSSKKRKRKKRR